MQNDSTSNPMHMVYVDNLHFTWVFSRFVYRFNSSHLKYEQFFADNAKIYMLWYQANDVLILSNLKLFISCGLEATSKSQAT